MYVARTSSLVCGSRLLVMPRGGVVRLVLGFLEGARDVDHGEHAEDEGLEERDQDLQRHEEADHEDCGDEGAGGADQQPTERARQRPAPQTVDAHPAKETGEW